MISQNAHEDAGQHLVVDGVPVIAIVGPTASGKTALAIQLAKKFGGEIICADSRTVYTGLDVGTAKPTSDERAMVPHWGVDLAYPNERFTVVDFQKYAYQKIMEIHRRGHIPFLVGGTGLYVDAVMYRFSFPKIDEMAVSLLRERFQKMDLTELHEYCKKNNIKLPDNYKNKRHVINMIVRNGHKNKRNYHLQPNNFIVGITTEKQILRERIHARAAEIISSETMQEAVQMGERYGWDNEAMTGNAYPLIHQYLLGNMTIDEVREKFERADWHLAKRQLTWLKRDCNIQWCTLDGAYTYCARLLESMSKS